ncbi:hypothetical protein [Breznakiella homolactica]|uniref:Uncharacterized protein n=1 Tax=Breznakiella homolactica TaxID=2798577 RepID=A0A7T8BB67_9SPIR|nr:hypothetical protein [Breznakiella homolactica]QQO09710.1 hypothetical protein JFL75_01980 [Breznakiella homolactica]
MKSLIIGIVILLAAVAAVIPAGLGWGPAVVFFLKGFVPVLLFLAGIVVVLVGIADMKDRGRPSGKGPEKPSQDPQ